MMKLALFLSSVLTAAGLSAGETQMAQLKKAGPFKH
jgi:hypothetical protein